MNNSELLYSSDATYQKAQYDASAKRLLGQKIILAHILIRVVDEFKGMDAETVASLIEGEPLLSQTMTAEQKLKLMKQEYDIPVDRRSIRKEVNIMCNLSEGVEEMGYAKGEAAGKVIGRSEGRADIILKMHKKGYSLEQIMDVSDMSETEIKEIIG